MCANFRKNHTKTVGEVAIWKKVDDIHPSTYPDISHPYYKLHWLRASSRANKNHSLICSVSS